jgi:hypothetical protein
LLRGTPFLVESGTPNKIVSLLLNIAASLKRSRSLAYTATTSVRWSFLAKADSLKALTFGENPDSFGGYECSLPRLAQSSQQNAAGTAG